jgi:hypothetical protein
VNFVIFARLIIGDSTLGTRDAPFVIVVKLLLTRNATKTQVPAYVNLEFRDPSVDVVMLNPGIWDPMVVKNVLVILITPLGVHVTKKLANVNVWKVW